MVANTPMPVALIGVRRPKRKPHIGSEFGEQRRVACEIEPREAKLGPGTNMAWADPQHNHLAPVALKRLHSCSDIDCFEVSAERLAGGRRCVDHARGAQGRNQIAECQRQRSAVSHDISNSGPGADVSDTHSHSTDVGVELTQDNPNSCKRLAKCRRPRLSAVALCLFPSPCVHLVAEVAQLHDVARTKLALIFAAQVPVHDVRATCSEAAFDSCGVDDYLVSNLDWTHLLAQGVSRDGLVRIDLYLHLDEAGTLGADGSHTRSTKGGHSPTDCRSACRHGRHRP
jgi:hypothetical protein